MVSVWYDATARLLGQLAQNYTHAQQDVYGEEKRDTVDNANMSNSLKYDNFVLFVSSSVRWLLLLLLLRLLLASTTSGGSFAQRAFWHLQCNRRTELFTDNISCVFIHGWWVLLSARRQHKSQMCVYVSFRVAQFNEPTRDCTNQAVFV